MLTQYSTRSDSTDLDSKEAISHIENVKTRQDLYELETVPEDEIDDQILEFIEDTPIEIDEETNKRLLKMIHRRILPCMIGTYFLQALDKGTLSFSSIMGIQTDAHLVGQQYSWLTTCTYIAVLVFELPTNFFIQKLPVAKYLTINIVLWGIVLGCHALGKNFAILCTVRTLLGAFESVCQPAFILMSSMWYKREEQAFIVSLWYMMNGGQQIVGGLLSYCFTLITDAKLRNWEILFLTYGCITVVWGIFIFFYTPDSPMTATCFSEEDRKLMIERVRSNQTGLQNKKIKKEHLIQALKDPQTYCYFFIQLFTALPTSGLGSFANIIIKGFGFSTLQTQLLAMVLGAYLIVLLLSSAYFSKKFQQNILLMICYVIPSIVGTIVLMTLTYTEYTKGTHTYKVRTGVLLFCYYLTLSFWGVANLGLSMMSRNVAGQSKKSITTTLNFIGWAVGNIIGPQVFLTKESPRYMTAFSVHLGCYGLLIILLVFMRFWLVRENKRKDQLIANGAKVDVDMKKAFSDITDVDNVNFRYVY